MLKLKKIYLFQIVFVLYFAQCMGASSVLQKLQSVIKNNPRKALLIAASLGIGQRLAKFKRSHGTVFMGASPLMSILLYKNSNRFDLLWDWIKNLKEGISKKISLEIPKKIEENFNDYTGKGDMTINFVLKDDSISNETKKKIEEIGKNIIKYKQKFFCQKRPIAGAALTCGLAILSKKSVIDTLSKHPYKILLAGFAGAIAFDFGLKKLAEKVLRPSADPTVKLVRLTYQLHDAYVNAEVEKAENILKKMTIFVQKIKDGKTIVVPYLLPNFSYKEQKEKIKYVFDLLFEALEEKPKSEIVKEKPQPENKEEKQPGPISKNIKSE